MKELKIKDLFHISKGKKVEQVALRNQDTARFIQIDDLRNSNNIKYCMNSDKYVYAKKEDIVIAWDGANAGTIGYNLEGAIGSTLAVLKRNSKDFNSTYVARFMQSKSKFLRDNCSGATIPHISRKVLEDVIVPLPSIETQDEIVNLLDIAQSLVEKRKAQIAALSDLTKSIFLEMFGDPIKNKNNWKIKKLGELSTVVRGGSPRPINNYLGGTVPWIKIGDGTLGDNIYLRNTKEKIIEDGIKKSRMIPRGSLIFANCGVSLGFARIITFEGCIHDGWLAFENISIDIDKIFLLKLLNFYTNYFRQTAPDGTQPNLNTSIMKSFGVIMPPIDLQKKYVERLFKLEKQKTLLENSLTLLELNFNSLMQRAFNGELFKD